MLSAAFLATLLYGAGPSQPVSARTADRMAAMEAELAELQPETGRSLRSTPVTIDVHDADLRRVLVTLADQIGGRAGLPTWSLDKKITLAAQNSPLSEVMDDLCTTIGCRWKVAMRNGKPLLSIARGTQVYGTEIKVVPLKDNVYELVASIKGGDGGQELLARPKLRLRSGETAQVGSTLPDADILLSATIDPVGALYSITISRDGAVEYRHSASLKLSGSAVLSPNDDWDQGVCARRGGEVRKLNPHGSTEFFSCEGNIELFPCANLPAGEAPVLSGSRRRVGEP